MNDNNTPKLNIRTPQQDMLGFNNDFIQPDLTPYYNPNIGTVPNKVITPASNSNLASLQIQRGISPGNPQDGDISNTGTLQMYQSRTVENIPYMAVIPNKYGWNQNSTYTVSGDFETGGSQRNLNAPMGPDTLPFISKENIRIGLSIYIKCFGYLSTLTSSSKYDLIFTLYEGNFQPFNPVIVCTTGSVSITDNLSNQYFSVEAIATVTSIGVTSTLTGQGLFQYMDTGTLKGAGMVSTTQTTFDPTQDHGIAMVANSTSGDKITFNCTNSYIMVF